MDRAGYIEINQSFEVVLIWGFEVLVMLERGTENFEVVLIWGFDVLVMLEGCTENAHTQKSVHERFNLGGRKEFWTHDFTLL